MARAVLRPVAMLYSKCSPKRPSVLSKHCGASRLAVSQLTRPRGSLRQWLLGASLIAVLAGYGVLLLAYAWLSELDRKESHRQLTSRLVALVERGDTLAGDASLSGVVSWLETDGRPAPLAPAGVRDSSLPPLALVRRQPSKSVVAGSWSYRGRTYLSSAIGLVSPRSGVTLHVLEDVTPDIRRQRRNTVLLLAFAGISSLVSAALLRPVLDAGLRPLEELSERMEQIETETLARQRLPLAPQPRELQRIAATFNDLLDRLAVSWERQRAFVNAVSHELRTPITLVAGYAGRLQRRGVNLSPSEQDQLQLIQAEAARMGSMVTDLLDIARSDAGQLTLRRQPFAVAGACLQVIERLRPMAGHRLILASGSSDEEAAVEALGDPDRFEQCLLNLVENALKYSPASSPVSLAWQRQHPWVVVHVLDEGPGVPQEDRGRLLERFQRGRDTGDVPGSGIGLAVVDTLMQAMGGSVEIGDSPQGGADFQLLLPEARPSFAPLRTPGSSDHRAGPEVLS